MLNLGLIKTKEEFEEAFNKLIEKKIVINIQNIETNSEIYKLSLNRLKHLIRADHLAEILSEDKQSDYYKSLFLIFSQSLTLSSWTKKKEEVLSIKQIIAENENSIDEFKIRESIDKLTEEYSFFSFDTEKDCLTLKNSELIYFLKKEFIENYLTTKYGFEGLRIIKSIRSISNNTEKILQEFCLLPVTKFRDVTNTLIEDLIISKYIYFSFSKLV